MRDISTAGLAALRAGLAKGALLVYLDLAAGPLRLTSAQRSVTWGGHTYLGTGTLGSVEPVTDRVGEGERAGHKLSLSGVPTAVIASTLGASVRDRPYTEHLAIFDADTEQVLDVLPLAAGRLDRAGIVRTAESRSVEVGAQHIANWYARPKPLRNTDADQRRLHAGDTSRRWLLQQAQHKDTWPAASWYRKQGA